MNNTAVAQESAFDPAEFRRMLEHFLVRTAILLVVVVVLALIALLLLKLPTFLGLHPEVWVFAVGEFSLGALAVGYFACGGLAIGGVAIGLGAFGVIAFGNYAVGLVAFGNRAIGLVAIGNTATGLIAIGLGGAIQRPPVFSGGRGAIGYIAIGGSARGTYVLAWEGEGKHVLDHRRQDPKAVRFFCKCLPRLRRAFSGQQG